MTAPQPRPVTALLDPFSGIAGDMLLGALVDVGLPAGFIEALPGVLGLPGVGVRVARTTRAGISAVKVDFDIPPQPHGRHLKQIVAIVDRAPIPERVKRRAREAFELIATVEAHAHGTTVERVHLHEVGAVDAILDVVGTLWGLAELRVHDVRCGPIALGDGSVETAHGVMPVPAPATLAILAGWEVQPGPPGSGELATPTGAALVRVAATGPLPGSYVPLRTGYGAGTKEFRDRPNVLRLTLCEAGASLGERPRALLAADVDDMPAEQLAVAADALRGLGALDVFLVPVVMKKGRPGTRIEVVAEEGDVAALTAAILMKTSSIGVRRTPIFRTELDRVVDEVTVLGHRVRVKLSTLPSGERRVKPEADDVRKVTEATGATWDEISALAIAAARDLRGGV